MLQIKPSFLMLAQNLIAHIFWSDARKCISSFDNCILIMAISSLNKSLIEVLLLVFRQLFSITAQYNEGIRIRFIR